MSIDSFEGQKACTSFGYSDVLSPCIVAVCMFYILCTTFCGYYLLTVIVVSAPEGHL